MDDEFWDNVFSDAEMVEMSEISNQIVFNAQHGFVANMALSNEQCINLVYHFHNSKKSNNIRNMNLDSINFIAGFVSYFMEFIEHHLESQGINWEEQFDD